MPTPLKGGTSFFLSLLFLLLLPSFWRACSPALLFDNSICGGSMESSAHEETLRRNGFHFVNGLVESCCREREREREDHLLHRTHQPSHPDFPPLSQASQPFSPGFLHTKHNLTKLSLQILLDVCVDYDRAWKTLEQASSP